MPYKRRKDGHNYIGQIHELIENDNSWSHGRVSDMGVFKRDSGMVKLRLGLQMWDREGRLGYTENYYFYAYNSIEMAAKKALDFLKEIDTIMNKQREGMGLE